MAEEAGGDDEPGDVPAGIGIGNPAQQRRVVRGARTGPRRGFQEFQFGDGGHQHLGVAEQLVHAAR